MRRRRMQAEGEGEGEEEEEEPRVGRMMEDEGGAGPSTSSAAGAGGRRKSGKCGTGVRCGAAEAGEGYSGRWCRLGWRGGQEIV